MNETVIFNIPLIEWIGYIASTIVLVSLSLSSILKLRIINLFGSLLFAIYGFYIGSLPVGLMNLAIVFFNLYYLRKLLFQKDIFEIVETNNQQVFVQKFLEYFHKDIQKYFPEFKAQTKNNQLVLAVMRNMNFAGVFIANVKEDYLEVELDYVSPQYRDYKNATFLFDHFKKSIKSKSFQFVKAYSKVPKQINYLKKLGFVEDNSSNEIDAYLLKL